MAKYIIHDASIYAYYRHLIEFNKKSRCEVETEELNTALNLNIILCSACLIEGVLEDRGKLLLGYYREIFNLIKNPQFELRKPINHFYNNVEEYLSKRVSQSTGLENYATLYEIFTGYSLKQHGQVSAIYESVNVLFQLRNVIAHGRLVHAYELEAFYTNGVEEYFCGGYKKAEDYLIKKGLLTERFIDGNSSKLYFTNEIANHFSEIAQKFIAAVDSYIIDSLQIGDLLQTRLKEYNEMHHTSYDIMAFLRVRGTGI